MFQLRLLLPGGPRLRLLRPGGVSSALVGFGFICSALVGFSSSLVGFGFLCSALVGISSALVGFGFICSALAGFLLCQLCLHPLDLRCIDLALRSTWFRLCSTSLLDYVVVGASGSRSFEGGYCHGHHLSHLCTAFPSIPLAPHLHFLVSHSHLTSISESSSPVPANQAPYKRTLTPHT